MLPSMYAHTEHEIFPPDVCYSGEAVHSSGWNQPNDLVLSSNSEQSAIASDENADSVNQSLQNINEDHSLSDDNLELSDSLEGAVGGMLPDLCVTSAGTINVSSIFKSSNSSLNEHEVSCYEKYLNSCEFVIDETRNTEDDIITESQIKPILVNQEIYPDVEPNSSDALYLKSDEVDLNFSEETRSEKFISNDYLVHNCQQISLVACGTGDVQQEHDFKVEKTSDVNSASNLGLCCDQFGALDKLCDLQTFGYDLVRQNLTQSSDPSYHKWECSAVIPSYLLPPFSLHSHGTSLGCDSGSSYILNFPVNRPLINDSEPQLSEEEQIKMAKRCGLITHLPCGIFDGSAKSRECVICMIDFSEGDKVRYLPCMHTYHTECIDDWLMRSFTCPSCLEPVDAALLNTYETS